MNLHDEKKAMTPQAKSALEYYQQKLVSLDKERLHILSSIEYIKREEGPTREAPPPMEAPPPKSPPPGKKKYRMNSKGEPSTASLVAEAGKAQASDFTLVELRAYLDEHFPERSAALTNDDLSKQVYIVAHRGQFLKTGQTSKGGMNTYTYNHSYDTKK